MDIVVTLPKGDLSHLEEKIEVIEFNDELLWSDQGYSWWDMKREPKKVSEADKVFVVCGGDVVGYFTIRAILHEGDYSTAYAILKSISHMLENTGLPEDPYIRIVFQSWQYIRKISMKGFQGFRYRNFDFEKIDGESENQSSTTSQEEKV